MEFGLSKIAAPSDGEDRKESISGVIIEWIWRMVVVILEVNAALEGNSCVRLNSIINT